jgi:hypothetical protein
MIRRLLLALVAMAIVAGPGLLAQEQPADPNAAVSFEAASIKPTATSDGNSFVRRQPGGRFDAAPTIFTAVQEQLGLKLDSTKGPVEVWVIDSIEKPTPD